MDEYFDCTELSARLKISTCAARHLSGSFISCTGCIIGSKHAEKPIIPTLPEKICARCHKPSVRLIKKLHCPSCYNRELEVIKGKNAKGAPPVHARKLEDMIIPLSVDGKLVMAKVKVADKMEGDIVVDRKHPGCVRLPLVKRYELGMICLN